MQKLNSSTLEAFTCGRDGGNPLWKMMMLATWPSHFFLGRGNSLISKLSGLLGKVFIQAISKAQFGPQRLGVCVHNVGCQ